MKESEFKFVDPYLEKLVFFENKSFDAKKQEVKFENIFDIEINRKENENIAKVVLQLQVGTDGEAPFKLWIRVASNFMWENLSEEILDIMLNNNAPALLLGYMRPIVASITNSSKFPTYNLPFMNFKD